MAFAADIFEKLRDRPLFGPLFLAAILFYLTFHAISGERGFYALFKETRRLELLKAELAIVSGQKAEVEHRVRLLEDGSIDLDLLDEESRNMLGYARPDEVVYFPEE